MHARSPGFSLSLPFYRVSKPAQSLRSVKGYLSQGRDRKATPRKPQAAEPCRADKRLEQDFRRLAEKGRFAKLPKGGRNAHKAGFAAKYLRINKPARPS